MKEKGKDSRSTRRENVDIENSMRRHQIGKITKKKENLGQRNHVLYPHDGVFTCKALVQSQGVELRALLAELSGTIANPTYR